METDEDILDTSQLEFRGDFNYQVQEVLQYIRLQSYQVEQLSELLNDLYHTLSAVWSDIHVTGFGSIVTGLGIKTSDIDCYVELPSWLHPPEKSFVLKAKNILMKQQHIFQDAFAITNAKVPIVQFYHLPTKMHCDLSFNSAAGVENSKLIAYLFKSDRRALELAILVKYWSKVHKLSGKNLMPTYCLTLLVIFFLQQYNILQPIKDIQMNIQENYIDQWNYAFGQLTNQITNDNTLYEFLRDFFIYYDTFEYDKYIISPYLGRPIKRDLFEKVDTVPREFSLYKINIGSKNFKPIRLDGVMCVQDPFDHSRNCAVAVYPKLSLKILTKVKEAVTIVQSVSKNEFLQKLLCSCVSIESQVDNKQYTNSKRKQVPHHGIKKQYKYNQTFRHLKQNVRQNNLKNLRQNNFRGKNKGTWRQT